MNLEEIRQSFNPEKWKQLHENQPLRVLVWTPDHQQFIGWCHDHDIHPQSGNVRQVLRLEDFLGFDDMWQISMPSSPYRIAKRIGPFEMHAIDELLTSRGIRWLYLHEYETFKQAL